MPNFRNHNIYIYIYIIHARLYIYIYIYIYAYTSARMYRERGRKCLQGSVYLRHTDWEPACMCVCVCVCMCRRLHGSVTFRRSICVKLTLLTVSLRSATHAAGTLAVTFTDTLGCIEPNCFRKVKGQNTCKCNHSVNSRYLIKGRWCIRNC